MTSRTDRHQEIDNYLDTLHDFGLTPVNGTSLRQTLIVEHTDYWAASSVRESSPWTTPVFEALTALRTRGGDPVSLAIRPMSTSAEKARSATLLTRVVRRRALGYWLANLLQCTIRKPPQLSGTVVLVVYMPAGHTTADAAVLTKRYFGDLPEVLSSQSLSYSVLLLPTESRPVSYRSRRNPRSHQSVVTNAAVISSFARPGALWRAFRNWRVLQRALPRPAKLIEGPTQTSMQVFARVMTRCITESFYGTIAARTALYTELFMQALHAAPEAKVVVYPFEGQGWESTLEQAAARRGIATLPYLHTVMKPWDLRAHTALRECAPAGVWVHGPHDEAELVRHGVALHRVEALRYQYLGAARNPNFPRAEGEHQRVGQRILVTLGADCENSQAEMIAFCEAAQRLQPTWKMHVRLHPQCLATQVPVAGGITTSRGSLSDDLAQCTSAFLCGTAAPLDSYLFGLPTVALRMSDGFGMNPLEADERFAYVDTADEAVQWLATAVQSTGAKTDVARFFDIASELPRWHSFVRSLAC